MMIKRTGIRAPGNERLFDVVNYTILFLLMIVTLYPFLYVLFASLSNASQLMRHTGLLLAPAGFSLKAYESVFRNPNIYIGYGNTIFYLLAGSFLNVAFTAIGAYVLSKSYLMLRRALALFCIFTMYFSGGLIPSYLLIQDLHLFNTRWALILPGLVSTWNLMIMTTAFRSLPISLEESARLDGAGEWTILLRIFLPLSIPMMAVMFLFYGVGHWNSWFGAMIYLRNRMFYPLQLFLREILIQNQMSDMMAASGGGTNEAAQISETIKYATVMVATIPILCVYPFLQKYFVNGVMIGAVKG